MKTLARWLLAAGMVFAGLSHLFWARKEFRAQVPDWAVRRVPIDKDAVVVASGGMEILLGASLLVFPKERRRAGGFLAAFFVAVLPGNVDQYVKRRPAFGMDSDALRLSRLFFQPVLIAWALWATSPERRARVEPARDEDPAALEERAAR